MRYWRKQVPKPVTFHWRLRHLALKLGRAYITVSVQLIFSRNGNGLTLLRMKLHVIIILLPVLKEIFHSFLNFVAWIVICPINESSQNFPSLCRQLSVLCEPIRLSFSSQHRICCCWAAEDRMLESHHCRSSHWCFTTRTSAPCAILRDIFFTAFSRTDMLILEWSHSMFDKNKIYQHLLLNQVWVRTSNHNTITFQFPSKALFILNVILWSWSYCYRTKDI